MVEVLVVGQTPPPYGGQAVMIEQLLNCDFEGTQFHHIRMSFSEDMDSIGRFQLRKIWHLILVVVRIFVARIRFRTSVLYYPPAGPNRVPFYRDALILMLTRWMFKKTVFHFHASGISSLFSRLNRFEKRLFRLAYFKPTLAIRTSALNPDDGIFLKSQHSVVIENCLPDVYSKFKDEIEKRGGHIVPRILFVGALYESKGIRILVDACRILKGQGVSFELECVGRFESKEYEAEILALVESSELNDQSIFPGVLSGDDKWNAYARADIFCFPSFFESESFGLVNIEAMQFRLPVVSTNWRGIPGVITDGENGYLAEIKDPGQIADRLRKLIEDKDFRAQFGKAGRMTFLQRFSESIWSKRMDEVLRDI